MRKLIPWKTGRQQRSRGVVIVIVTLLLIVIVPLIGLAIDGGVIYFLKGKLQQAVDAAALAGGRSLSSGLTLSAQSASAVAAANQYFSANYSSTFWGSSVTSFSAVPTEDDDAHTRYVTVSATASSPLYFLRVLGKTTVTIGASAQAKRRDLNVMLVLDRSGSMGTAGAMPDMLAGATDLVNQLAPGRDHVGLVSFGGTYYLVQPTTNFQPSLVNTIAEVQSSGSTNTATALWVAYQALSTITNPQGQNTGEPGALNVIVFFTDGQPNDITATFNSPGSSVMKNTNCAKNGLLTGFMATLFYENRNGQPTGQTTTSGVFGPVATGPSDPGDSTSSELVANRVGCNFASNPDDFYTDITSIPTSDVFGNLTNPSNPYKQVNLAGITSGSGTDLINASFNAADQAAQRMRTGYLNEIVPAIYAISLLDDPSSPTDPVFMKRIANTLDSPIYTTSAPAGTYFNATSAGQLENAFNQIASQVLALDQ